MKRGIISIVLMEQNFSKLGKQFVVFAHQNKVRCVII